MTHDDKTSCYALTREQINNVMVAASKPCGDPLADELRGVVLPLCRMALAYLDQQPELARLRAVESSDVVKIMDHINAERRPVEREAWPDDFDCGFKHAMHIASIHSGLLPAMNALQAECEGHSDAPENTECPYCGVRLKNSRPQRDIDDAHQGQEGK